MKPIKKTEAEAEILMDAGVKLSGIYNTPEQLLDAVNRVEAMVNEMSENEPGCAHMEAAESILLKLQEAYSDVEGSIALLGDISAGEVVPDGLEIMRYIKKKKDKQMGGNRAAEFEKSLLTTAVECALIGAFNELDKKEEK